MTTTMARVRMETLSGMTRTVREFQTMAEAQVFAAERRLSRDAVAGTKRYWAEADPELCPHPPARRYWGGVRVERAARRAAIVADWVACCDCGSVLAGAAEPPDAPR